MSQSVEDNEKITLCVGLCVLDIVQVCETYPVEDSDKRSKYGRWQRGGNASNMCTVLAQMNTKCEYLGCLSTAKWFNFVIDDCRDRAIQIDNCIYYDCEPPLSSVILNEATGSRTIIHSNPNLPIFKFVDFEKINLNNYKWIHFEGRNPEETCQMMKMIIEWNQKHSFRQPIRISLELEKLRPEIIELAQYAEILFLGKDLAEYLGYTDKTSAVYKLREKIQTRNIIICTWGTDGVAALDTQDRLYTCPAYPPDVVVDSLGAGDTFAASTIFALNQKKSLQEVIDFASRIAGAKVGFFGYDKIKDIYQKCN